MRRLPKYHWIPDVPDFRDFTFKKMGLKAIKLPSKVDLRPMCSTIEDQGQLGSCTGNALVGAMEVLENIEKQSFIDLSRLFVYYNERVIEHTVSQDAGAQIRDGVKTLAVKGVCPESEWPYNINKFTMKPTTQCYKDALKRRVTSYYRIQTLDEMKQCLASGFPITFGFSVYTYFESERMAKTGILYMPKKGEQLLGGHAVLFVGYNDATQRGIVRNSWGAEWGMEGYFTMPYAYLTDRNLSDDFWAIKK